MPGVLCERKRKLTESTVGVSVLGTIKCDGKWDTNV